MTTIAYRDGVMAGDSRGYSSSRYPIGSKVKVERLPDGTLLGASSTIPGGAETARAWWNARQTDDHHDIELPASFTLLIVKPNGEVYYVNDTHHVAGPLRGEFFAIGSGGEYAQGAMQMGATAVEALRAACKLDPWSELPIFAVRHASAGRWRVGA